MLALLGCSICANRYRALGTPKPAPAPGALRSPSNQHARLCSITFNCSVPARAPRAHAVSMPSCTREQAPPSQVSCCWQARKHTLLRPADTSTLHLAPAASRCLAELSSASACALSPATSAAIGLTGWLARATLGLRCVGMCLLHGAAARRCCMAAAAAAAVVMM